MKESTKTAIKVIGGISGAVGGSCAASVIIGAIAAVNPIAGVTGFIGKIVISSVIAERCSEYITDKVDAAIEVTEEFHEAVNAIATEVVDSINKVNDGEDAEEVAKDLEKKINEQYEKF